MTDRKPSECPACGHERIARGPRATPGDAGRLRPWICGLCRYQWVPASPPPAAGEREFA